MINPCFYHRQGSLNFNLFRWYPYNNSSNSHITKFMSHLSTVFHMKDLADVYLFLELQFTHNESTTTIIQTH